jgi:hypothetical protein
MLSEKIAITKPYVCFCEQNRRLLQICNRLFLAQEFTSKLQDSSQARIAVGLK